jgi:hypothetical protein
MSLTEIQKQNGVYKRTVLLAKQKNHTYAYITFTKKAMFTQLKFLIFESVDLLSAYEFFFGQP